MIKKIISVLILMSFLIVSLQPVSSLQTYVGIKILNLTDDPSASCAGEDGYGYQGRIRGLSSILPDFPIYFELRDAVDDSLIWAGDSTEDADYKIGDIIQMPQLVDLTIGKEYKLFFDINAIRIYLPLESHNDFERTINDIYWTAGEIGSDNTYETVYGQHYSDICTTTRDIDSRTTRQKNLMFISNTRNSSKLIHNCMHDGIEDNCNQYGITGITKDRISTYTSDFNIDNQYENLHNSTVGTSEFIFTFN